MLEPDLMDPLRPPTRDAEPSPAGGATRWAVKAIEWALFLGGCVLLLRPVLHTAIVADDFVNPFSQFADVGLGFRGLVSRSLSHTQAAGHFNLLGQVFGALVNEIWIYLMGRFGIRYSTIYAVTKYLVFVTAVLSLTRLIATGLAALGRRVAKSKVRAISAVALFGLLQLHVGWSNDPVGSYPLSGYLAAALGFLALSETLRMSVEPSLRRVAWVASVTIVAILYYELNIAVLAGQLPLLVWSVLSQVNGRRWPALRHAALASAIPIIAVALVRFVLLPPSDIYSGTQVAVGKRAINVFVINLVSSLPGAAWALTGDYLSGLNLHWLAVLTVAGGLAATGLASAIGRAEALRFSGKPSLVPAHRPERRHAGVAIALVTAILGYWWAATLIQAVTVKVQDETPRIGYVYNYYAVGSMAIACLLALSFTTSRRAVRRLAAPAVIVVIMWQANLNYNITYQHNRSVEPNRRLLVAATEDAPMEFRCRAIRDWTAGGWPDYYEIEMTRGLQAMHQHFYGRPFCAGFSR